MITTTDVPGILRVTFKHEVDDYKQYEIVSFVRPEENGIGIYYCHHELRSRATPAGLWSVDMRVRQELDPGLQMLVQVGVMTELLGGVAVAVRVLPCDIDQRIARAQFEVPAA